LPLASFASNSSSLSMARAARRIIKRWVIEGEPPT
jgi:hypothetical protein